MKILILKPSSLGDVVHAVPVLRLLKRHLPGAEIHWWIHCDLMPLLEGDADLASLIPFDRKRWGTPGGWPDAIRIVRQMRRARFDWVIDLQALARSAIVAWFARGRFTIGLDDRREGAPIFYDEAVPRPSRDTHAVDWYLEVLRRLDVPVHRDFEWFPPRKDAAARIEQRWPGAGRRWILLQPGARWLNKRWPVENFARLVSQLAARDTSLAFAVLGGPGDSALSAELIRSAGVPVTDLTGQISLPEMVEWIRRAAVLVTNDTGPMHVAAALKTPVVALFGPTDPRRTGPYGMADSVLRRELACAPCMKPECRNPVALECLHRIETQAAAAAVWRHLERGAAGARETQGQCLAR